ncbi:MAG: LacI family transcriptional regulator [Actinobacteria bacterium]|nr:LacI family transcriptional regulator [Actinomycetota bacterium]
MTAKVTLADVALRAGVSQAAASKVFNDRADVSAATATRVRRAAEELGYRAPVRRSASDRVSVWVVIDTINNYYAPDVLSGMLLEGHAHGALTVVSQVQGNTGSPSPGSKKWMTDAHRQGAQAFIFVTTTVTDQALETARQLSAPLVVVDPVNRPPLGVATVGATNFRGGRDAVDHLIALGHRRIAYVGANLDSTPGGERLAGYLDGLRNADIPVDRSLIVPGRFNSDDGRAAVSLLRRSDPPTAIFAASDAVAFGVYDACHEQGVRIPDDVSVVGFDDGQGGELVWPHLTTVRQPLVEMGRHAVGICISAVQDKSLTPPPVELATNLVVRNSTGPASDKARNA